MDTRPVREGKSAGVIHLISGALVLQWAIRKVVSPDEIPTYREVQNAFVYQYGGGVIALILGAVLLVIGLWCFRSETPTEVPTALVYIYEPPSFLGAVLGAPCILFGVMCLVAIAPYTAERGIVLGQIGAALVLVLFSFGSAWVFLHYRRTAVVDPEAQRFEIRYGKQWVVKRSSFPFSDFSGVSIQVVPRKRGQIYRAMAGGDGKKPQLIAFFYHEVPAKQACADIARVTRWHDLSG